MRRRFHVLEANAVHVSSQSALVMAQTSTAKRSGVVASVARPDLAEVCGRTGDGMLGQHRRLSGLLAVRQAAAACMLLRNWVVGRPHTLEVFQERLGPRRGIVFLYPRQ